MPTYKRTTKHHSLAAVAVCDMLSCASALNGIAKRIREKVNGLLFAVLLLFGPKGNDYHHCWGIFFVFKSCFLSEHHSVLVSRPDSSSSKRTVQNIHLAQRCCFGAAGCQALLLIVPASCAEARASKRKEKKKAV